MRDPVNSATTLIRDQVLPDPDVICQRMGRGVVLLNLRTDRFYELNPTAARLWELLSEKTDPALIQEILCDEFEVDRAQLTHQITDLMVSLRREGLIIDSERPMSQKEKQ